MSLFFLSTTDKCPVVALEYTQKGWNRILKAPREGFIDKTLTLPPPSFRLYSYCSCAGGKDRPALWLLDHRDAALAHSGRLGQAVIPYSL